MMSMPAASMSRMAVWAASSNISPRSVGPNSSRSSAFTDANHQPGLPCEPTTELGRIGSSAMGSAPSDVGVGGSYDSLRHKSVEIEGGPQKAAGGAQKSASHPGGTVEELYRRVRDKRRIHGRRSRKLATEQMWS